MSMAPMMGVADGQGRLPAIGLIGGMSWRSTTLHYGRINDSIDRQFDGACNARVIVASLDYASLLRAANAQRWDLVEAAIVDAGRWLEQSGCSVIALTAVTAHLSHAALSAAVASNVPHVFDASRNWLDEARIDRVGVLGTGRTCTSSFVRERLGAGTERQVIFAPEDLQASIDRMIYERLASAQVEPTDRQLLLEAIESLRAEGAQAVLLACTELPLLMPLPATLQLPVIDTVALHVQAICELTLKARYS
jgi:aspartate racemase